MTEKPGSIAQNLAAPCTPENMKVRGPNISGRITSRGTQMAPRTAA